MSTHEMNGDPMDDWRFGFEVQSAQIGAAEVGQGVTYTIDAVEFRKVGEGREAKVRPVVKVRESDLEWVTCKTSLLCVEAMFGRSPRGWLGKRITLYWDASVKFGKEAVGGVRVAGAPGIRDQTVRVKLPKRADQMIDLVNTAEAKPEVDPSEAREKFLAYALGKGVTLEQVEGYLAGSGAMLEDLRVDNLRDLARDLDKIRAHAAGESDDGRLGE